MADLASKLLPVAEALLDPGEQLAGTCLATQVGVFKGRQVVIVTTDRRLVVQPMNRKFEPNGEPISLPPEQIASASADGAGEGWLQVNAAIMDHAAVTLKLRTVDGQKLKLMMMRGTGALGRLGGGEVQREGVEALAAWFAAREG